MIKKSSSSLDDFFSLPHRSIKNRFFLEFLLSPPMRNPTTHVSSYLLYICIIVAQHDPRFYSFLLTICPCLRLYSCVALLLLRSSFFLDCFSHPDSSDFVFDSIFISSYFFFSLPSTFFVFKSIPLRMHENDDEGGRTSFGRTRDRRDPRQEHALSICSLTSPPRSNDFDYLALYFLPLSPRYCFL